MWQQFADAGIPRDGGMADLRAAVASDNPPFSAVICENIERSGRDTFDALKLEKELRARHMVVFATDEPIDVQAAEGSTILVRRMKQGVAEYFKYQLKAQMWEGLRQYVIGGWNTGRIPYGYLPERSPHPNPIKANMGATRARLVPDPERGPWVTRIYEWRVYEKLSRLTIARRLARAGAPSPDGKGWSPQAVAGILKNPKYTGRVVLGRTRNTGTSTRKGERKVRPVPRAYWTWAADDNKHTELVDMDLWEKAQVIGAERGNVRDTEHQTPASASRTLYPLRARIRCNQCKRRMHGITRTGRGGATRYIYYVCPHDPKNPRHAQAHPQHARTCVQEEIITTALAGFMDTYLLGHDRAAMLDIQLPAGAAEEAGRRDRQAAALRDKLARIQTAQKGLLAQSEQLGDDKSPAACAYRDRIREQFTERYNEHAAIQAELDALTADTAPAINDPALLDELPYAPGLLPDAPDTIREALYAAFDVQCLYREDKEQVTIWATVTDTTPGIIAALLADPRTGSETAASTPSPALFADLQAAAIVAACKSALRRGRRGPRQPAPRSAPRSPSWALPTCSCITSGRSARTPQSAVTTRTGPTARPSGSWAPGSRPTPFCQSCVMAAGACCSQAAASRCTPTRNTHPCPSARPRCARTRKYCTTRLPRACSWVVLRRGLPSRARMSSSAKHVTPIWEIRLADQRTTRTVLPGRRAPAPLSKACRPWASGKVWLITARSLPVPASSASLASSPASGSTTKNIAWTLYLPASSWSGGAPRVTSRPPSRSRPYEPSSTAPPTVSMTTSNPPGAGPGCPAPAPMKRSAPRSRTKPASVLRPVAVTWPPRIAASWTANMPTPPAPPWTSTCSPGCRAAWSASACQAVSAAGGSVAAATWDSDCGLAARPTAGMTTYSAAAPSRSKSTRPITSSPTARPATPSPRPATVPDISWDGMTGVRSAPSRMVHSRSQVSSAKVIAAACTAMSASPGPADGACACS